VIFDWLSLDSSVLCNPAIPTEAIQELNGLIHATSDFKGHFWLSTSGSQNQKWVGLSKNAILASAESVNRFIDASHSDCWVQALPSFHVGGLGVFARAYLNGASVSDFRSDCKGPWSAQTFYDYLQSYQGTLTALVPAQLYDLIQLGRSAPSSLRAVIVGGGALPKSCYEQAIQLGWPVLPSYGLTECASQVATARLNGNDDLKVLPHVSIEIREERIWIKSRALLSVYAFRKEGSWTIIDPKVEGWLPTGDRAILSGDTLNLLGRVDHCIKIGGESVDMNLLEECLQSICREFDVYNLMTLVDKDEDRLGKVIYLVTEAIREDKLQLILDKFHQKVLPFERVRGVCFVDQIPRTPLFKIERAALKKRLG
jgi:o-succinylbenzoate---CoA ligase